MRWTVVLPALFALALAAPSRADDSFVCPDGVERLAGRKARIVLESGAVRSGRLVRVGAEGIVLRSNGEQRTFEAASIDRIELRAPGKAVRNILLGAGAGALAGVVFGAAYDEADSDSLAILFGWIGAGGGAGLGAALPARRAVCE